jgi:type II secretory pathway component PulJ
MGTSERLNDEQGTSLAELVVVIALLAIVGTMIAQSMVSAVRVSTSGEDRSFTLADTRTALERVERDIRAANPIETAATVSAYDTSVSFSIYCANAGTGSCGSDHLRLVTWRVVGNRLERAEGGVVGYELGPSGPAGYPVNQQRGAVVNPTIRPVFTYYDASGTRMPTAGVGALAPEQFRQCAKEVVVTLVANAESGTAPSTIDLSTSATIRNFHEVSGC